jgi:hypothetical protein
MVARNAYQQPIKLEGGKMSEYTEEERREAEEIRNDPIFDDLSRRLGQLIEEGDIHKLSLFVLNAQVMLNLAILTAQKLFGSEGKESAHG